MIHDICDPACESMSYETLINFILLYFHSTLLKTTLHDIGHLYKELYYYYYYYYYYLS